MAKTIQKGPGGEELVFSRIKRSKGRTLLKGDPPVTVSVLVRTTGRRYVDDVTGQVLAVEVRLPPDADDQLDMTELSCPFVSVGMLSTV